MKTNFKMFLDYSPLNMELYFQQFVIIGLVLAFMLLLFRFYDKYKKKCSGFPFTNIVTYLIYCQITGKISKDVPLNCVVFRKIVNEGEKHMKEGLFMSYLTRPILFIFSGDAIKAFTNEKAAIDVSSEYMIANDALGEGISTSNGERWRSKRKLISPAFQLGILKEKVTLFNEHAMNLVKDLEKQAGKPSVDIMEPVSYNYFNALIESIFGLKQSEENKAEILRMVEIVNYTSDVIAKRIFYPWLRPKFLLQLFPFGRKYYQDIKESDVFINKLISEMKQHVSYNEIMDTDRFGTHLRNSFTYILLNQHLKDPAFTFEELRTEVKHITVTGYHTVTCTTMWCLFLLGLHPEVQQKVFNEIQSLTSDSITYEESSHLVFLEAVIMETLRICPTVPLYSRNLSEDVQYGKYKVSKDTTIAFFPYLSHRDPKVFPDPEKFKPERFLNAETRKSWNFIPFAEGNRACLGKNYGLIKMKIFLAHILRNFEITSLDRREDVRLSWIIFSVPVKPLRMKVTLRHNTSL